ncbi:putative uncharacterized protein [Waddlia chondrophila 2032/99]|nr:hypothetical protein [Waddlia chondrophila]CCB91662.1 putative uncharacterized protein [Waddlia chondrophila 2032/99]
MSEVLQKFEKLADALVKDLKDGDQSEMETFESYVQRTKHEIMDEMMAFQDSFTQGYEVILSELASNKKEGGLPPGAMRM